MVHEIEKDILFQSSSAKGCLSNERSIKGHLSNQGQLLGRLATAYTTSALPYEGSYSVTPATFEQKLYTRNRNLIEDVTIRPIPFFEVSNQSGGQTVYIAGEVEME